MDARRKLISQADKFGLESLKKQQGTTRHLWDTLPVVTGQLYYRFFDGVNTRTFPFTNITDNKLEAGESLAIQYAILSLIEKDDTGAVKTISPIPPVSLLGDIALEVGNTTVMKPISLLPFISDWNRMPNADGNVYKFFNEIVLKPFVPFVWQMHVPAIPTPAVGSTLYFRLTIKGLGSILSPKATQ
jgi:hypothetical protein